MAKSSRTRRNDIDWTKWSVIAGSIVGFLGILVGWYFSNENLKITNVSLQKTDSSIIVSRQQYELSKEQYVDSKTQSEKSLNEAQEEAELQRNQFLETINYQKKQVEALFSSNKLLEEQINIGVVPDIDLVLEEPKVAYFMPEKLKENDCYFHHKVIFSNLPIRSQFVNAYKKDSIWKEEKLDESFINNFHQDFALLLLNNGSGIAKNLKIEMRFDTSKLIPLLTKMNSVIRYTNASFRREQGNSCWKMPITRQVLEQEGKQYISFVYPYIKLPQPIKIIIPSVYLDLYCWMLFNKYQGKKLNNGAFSYPNNEIEIDKFPPLKVKVSYMSIRNVPITKNFEVNIKENRFSGGYPILDVNSIHSNELFALIN